MNDLMTKSFMSYIDLKKAALKDLEAGPDPGVEMGAVVDEGLRAFLEEAEAVKAEMDSIQEALIRLQEANEESKSLHNPESLRSLRLRTNSDIAAVLKKAHAIRGRLAAMDGPRNPREAADRTRTAVTSGLRKKLRDQMMDFQALRQRMMAEYKDTVERRYYAVTGEIPSEEVIDRIISQGVVVEAQGRAELAAAVHEIQDRHDAAREVERSLLELHQVFLDMAVLVEAQGEQMDDIEHHVSHAAHYVKDGSKELAAAKGLQRSTRKWLCIGMILLLLLILVVVIPIVASVSK